MLELGNGNFFFHIPRTGGNYTIRTCRGLRRNGVKPSMRHFGHKHGGPLNACLRGDVERSFTILRPPIDWYRSFYRFRIYKHYGKGGMKPGHPLDFFIWKEAGGKVFSFNHFLTRVVKWYPFGYVTSLYCRFFPFVTDLLWLPNLTQQLPELLGSWGYDGPITLPPKPKNESPKDIPAECSKSVEEKVNNAEMQIINYLIKNHFMEYR